MPEWVLPATVSALATVIFFVGRGMLAKLDKIADSLSYAEMRLTRIETHLNLPPLPR